MSEQAQEQGFGMAAFMVGRVMQMMVAGLQEKDAELMRASRAKVRLVKVKGADYGKPELDEFADLVWGKLGGRYYRWHTDDPILRDVFLRREHIFIADDEKSVVLQTCRRQVREMKGSQEWQALSAQVDRQLRPNVLAS